MHHSQELFLEVPGSIGIQTPFEGKDHDPILSLFIDFHVDVSLWLFIARRRRQPKWNTAVGSTQKSIALPAICARA
jgi:hypothetical protein